jgi:hypothetical protein
MSIDKFLDRIKSKDYNCLDFAAEVWAEMFDAERATALKALCVAAHDGRIDWSIISKFERIREPHSPGLVFFLRKRQAPHVGIFLNGAVLHLGDNGAVYQDLDLIKLLSNVRVRFYK